MRMHKHVTSRLPQRIASLHVADIELPHEIERLYDLAYNLWWTWTPKARELFARFDTRNWSLYRNPVQLLSHVDHAQWQEKVEDGSFVALYSRVVASFDRYMAGGEDAWSARTHPQYRDPIAYFCMEFGLHPCLPLYSGGLGILAGDHLKSASDLGIPLIGVGLLYRNGYFHQTVDADGRQQQTFPDHDFTRLPVRPAAGSTGRPVFVDVPLHDRVVRAQVWVAEVGRVSLLLLDTDITQNDSADRPITSMLYTPGREMRLCQEIVLGVGGARALAALGIRPRVWHMNEGHSALLQFERLRPLLAAGETLEDGIRELRRGSVFTTHTPVPAGNEQFDESLVRKYFEPWCGEVGVDLDRWLALGQNSAPHVFNMTALAVRTSSRMNGVSKINATVSARMWDHLLPADAPLAERMQAITNGVHPSTWLGVELRDLYGAWFGERWPEILGGEGALEALRAQPGTALWEAHLAQKLRLARFLRSRLRDQRARHGLSPDELRTIERMFDPAALTIGFARRFATYKRADLLFSDLPRLRRLVGDAARPVQIVLAGKAHPADKAGQELIQHLVQLTRSETLEGRVFFVEDYDMRVGRMLVQGVDVWLNTPRRPLEASGTSGMKAAMNGALNLSIADGWWPEAFNGRNGWVIGAPADVDPPADQSEQDRSDALALYGLLESEVIPTYYERDERGIPQRWVAMMQEAIGTVSPAFSSDRMMRDYFESAYLPLLAAAD